MRHLTFLSDVVNQLSGACGAVLRGLWVAFMFHLLLWSFCCLTALFPEDIVLLQIKIWFLCSKDSFPFVIRSDFWANWGKPCFWLWVVFPFDQCIHNDCYYRDDERSMGSKKMKRLSLSFCSARTTETLSHAAFRQKNICVGHMFFFPCQHKAFVSLHPS